MAQVPRWLAALAVVVFVPGALPADSGSAAQWAGQKAEPNRADREQEHSIRAVRWARLLSRLRDLEEQRAAAPPLPAPESLRSRFAKAAFWPDRFVAESVVRWHRLRRDREEFRRLWMNNQPADRVK